MALSKCPKCELNYLKQDQKYCDVCVRDMAKAKAKEKENAEPLEICVECSENISAPGSDYCVECLREKYKLEYSDDSVADTDEDILIKVTSGGVEDIESLEIEPAEDLPGIENDLDDEDREGLDDEDDILDDSLERLAEEEDDDIDEGDEWE